MCKQGAVCFVARAADPISSIRRSLPEISQPRATEDRPNKKGLLRWICIIFVNLSEVMRTLRSYHNVGRGLFAKKPFRKGESLFEERPLVSAQFLWNSLYKYLACDNCLKSLETAEQSCRRMSGNPSLVLPYPDCCEVRPEIHVRCPSCQIQYCSEACREEAWGKYHQVLCMGASGQDADHPLARLQDAWRNMHYPPETCSVMLIARMLATVKQAKNKDSVIASFSEFCKTTVNEEEEIMHKLLGKEFQEQLELLRSLTLSALPVEELQQWFTTEGFRSVFALIGTNGQGIGTSSLSVWVRNCESLDVSEEERERIDSFIDQLYEDLDKVSGQFLNCEGSGLYSLQSTCNHSCVPNAEVTFPHDDYTLCVVALEDIPEGEEICICYLDECSRERSRHSRQKILRENYLFNCLCTKCVSQADDPDMTSEEEDEEDMEEDDG